MPLSPSSAATEILHPDLESNGLATSQDSPVDSRSLVVDEDDTTMIKTDWIQVHVEFQHPAKVSSDIDDSDTISI